MSHPNIPTVSEQEIIKGLGKLASLMMSVGVSASDVEQTLMNSSVSLNSTVDKQSSEYLSNVKKAAA
ncbi:MAG: hypothetical protein SP1CHLAM54_17620 [Chlamydiia bacterium]|nr:hypothetical protein [Chlamydiia bacterium]MCH9616650.1 hypothetical protein [Chlamydiia bacterium]MCH9629380.1 hypothetical protein [Chlamydiia bacterium]